MRKKLCLLAIVFATFFVVPWQLEAKVYLSEDFNSLTSGIPLGWDNSLVEDENVGQDLRWTLSENGFDGTRCLNVKLGNRVNLSNILSTKEVYFDANAELTFMFKNADGGRLDVAVTSDNATTFDTILADLKSSDWEERTVSLEKYRRVPNLRIVFMSSSSRSGSNSYHYIDDVVVRDQTTCAHPVDFYVSKVTHNSANLSWSLFDSGNIPDSYHLTVTRVVDNEIVIDQETLVSTDLTTELSGLNSNTVYRVIMTANCESQAKGYSRTSQPFLFTTSIEPIELSYTQTFDDKIDGLPYGWYTSSVKDEYAGIADDIKYGEFGGALKVTSSSLQDGVVLFPPMLHPANDITVKMLVRSLANTVFDFGIMTDPFDRTTFFPIKQNIEIDKGIQWTELELNTMSCSYSEEGACFAIIIPSEYESTVYFDNIEIKTLGTCPRPEDLIATKTSDTQATFSWIAKDGMDKYRVAVMTDNDTIYEETDENSVTITGLTPNTDYSVAVRCIKGEQVSEWSKTLLFSTYYEILNKPAYYQDFETNGLPYGWQTKCISEVKNDIWVSSTSKSHSGERSAELERDKEDNDILLISRPVTLSGTDEYILSFWMYRSPSYVGYDETGIVAWVNSIPDTIGGKRYSFISADCKVDPIAEREGWYYVEYNVDRKGVQFIMFEGINHGGRTYIDDIRLLPTSSCLPVKEITVASVSQQSATLSWEKAGKETQWLIDYTISDGVNTTTDKKTVTGTPEFTLDNLHKGTDYTISGRLSSYCSVGDTSLHTPFEIAFTTMCDPLTQFPLEEDFEAGIFPPECWQSKLSHAAKNGSIGDDDLQWNIHKGKVGEKTGQYVARFDISPIDLRATLVTPLLDLPNENYELIFYFYDDNDSGEGIVQVWINSTPDTIGGTKLVYVPKDGNRAQTNSGWTKYIVPLKVSGLKYIIFEGGNTDGNVGTYMYIDDVIVRQIPPCSDINEVYFDSIMYDQVRVVVEEQNIADWQLEYGEHGFTLGAGTQVDASGKHKILSNLKGSTQYDVYVRRKCGTEFSAWSTEPFIFSTPCEPVEVKGDKYFFEDFESYANNVVIGGCYTQYPEPDKFKGYMGSSGETRGENKIYPYNSSRMVKLRAGENRWIFLPFKLTAGTQYEVSARFAQSKSDENLAKASIFLTKAPTTENNSIITEIVKDRPFNNVWQVINGYFTVPEDGIYYIGWYIWQDESYFESAAIDNIYVTEATCGLPILQGATMTSPTSVQLNWLSGAEQFEVKVSESDIDPNTENGFIYHDTVSDKKAEIKDLKLSTEYHYYIRSLCGVRNTDWEHSVFRTQCEAKAIPYVTTFENDDTDGFACWRVAGNGSAQLNTSDALFGKYNLLSTDVCLISPELTIQSLYNCLLSGWVYSSDPNASFIVGLLPDITDYTSFVEFATINIGAQNKWEQFAVYFTELNDPDYAEYTHYKSFAIFVPANVTLKFDDISVTDKPKKCLQPTECVVDNYSSNDVTLSWQSNGDETEWRILLYRGGKIDRDTIVDEIPVMIGGLEPVTDYTAYIAAVCGVGEESDTVPAGSFRSECSVNAIPYRLDWLKYEEVPLCWDSIMGKGDVNWHASTGSSMNYFEYSNKVVENYASLCSPIFRTDAGMKMILDVELLNRFGGDLYVKISTDGGKTYPTVIDTVEATGYPITLSYNLSAYSGNDISVAFEAHSSGNGKYAARLLNFSLDLVEDCASPIDFKVTNILDTAIVVEFNDTTASHTQWQIIHGQSGFNINNAVPVQLEDDIMMINGLSPRTVYDVYVRSICGDSRYSAWRGPLTVTTKQSTTAAVPYHESFEVSLLDDISLTILNQNKVSEEKRVGLTQVYEVVYSPNVSFQTEMISDGQQGLALNSAVGEPLYVVLPKMDKPVEQLVIKFDYKNKCALSQVYELNPFSVGVMLDPSDMSTFVPLCIYQGQRNRTKVEYHFNTAGIDMTGAHIALRYISETNNTQGEILQIDNLRVEMEDECPVVDNMKLVYATESTAKFTVDSRGESMHYVYGSIGTPVDECKNGGEIVNGEFTITGLAKSTGYNVYARCVCQGADGEWFGPITITTAAEPSCFAPLDVQIDTIGTTEARFSWVVSSIADKSEYRIVAGTDTITDIVNEQELYIDTLKSQTYYKFDVRSVCDKDTSEWTSVTFVTNAVADTIPYFEGFEEYKDYSSIGRDWVTYGKLSSFNIRTKNTASEASYEGNAYISIYSFFDGSIVRRLALEGGKYYLVSMKAKCVGGAEVKVVMSDGKTDTDELAYYKVGDNYSDVYAVVYAPTTKEYIVGLHAMTLQRNSKRLCIDNFSVTEIEVGNPLDFIMTDFTTTSASFSWTGNVPKYQLQVLHHNEAVVDTTVTGASVKVEGLLPSVHYVAQVRSVGENITSDWQQLSFTTDCDIVGAPYAETFDNMAVNTIPACWDILSSDVVKALSWRVKSDNGNHKLVLPASAVDGYAEIQTLPISVESEDFALTFDYVNTTQSDELQIKVSADGVVFNEIATLTTDASEHQKFKLSEYVGKSVTVSFVVDATYWGHNYYNVSIDNFRIGSTGEDVIYIDTVCPGEDYKNNGFVVPADVLVAGSDYETSRVEQPTEEGGKLYTAYLKLHVLKGGSSNVDAVFCEGEEYEHPLFPERKFTEEGQFIARLEASDGCDSVVTLNLRYAVTQVDTTVMICEGEEYLFAGTSYKESGRYTHTEEGSYGCDSTITLYLTVVPSTYEHSHVMCTGDNYQWIDTTLTTTGRYERRYKNVLDCDSIEIMNLFVIPDTVNIDMTICQGKTLTVGDKIYDKTGVYHAGYKNSLGCDSVVEYRLTVLAADTLVESDYVCEGELYTGYGFTDLKVTKDTVLVKFKHVDGECDEVTRIDLDFVETVRVDSFLTISAGESVVFGGNTYTKTGVYGDTVPSETTGCDSVTTLHLTVGGTGTQILRVGNVVIAPNPITDGVDAVVSHRFTVAERSDMVVEVLNAIGQRVSIVQIDNVESEIRIPHTLFTASGVYHIRITTGTGDVYVGRVIVE